MKKYKLRRCERETVILLNDAEKIASISSTQGWMQRRLQKLAEEYPDEVKITRQDDYTLFADVPAKWVKVRPPRKVSETQRLAAAERLKKYREGKADIIPEEDLYDDFEEEDDEEIEDDFEEDEDEEDEEYEEDEK